MHLTADEVTPASIPISSSITYMWIFQVFTYKQPYPISIFYHFISSSNSLISKKQVYIFSCLVAETIPYSMCPGLLFVETLWNRSTSACFNLKKTSFGIQQAGAEALFLSSFIPFFGSPLLFFPIHSSNYHCCSLCVMFCLLVPIGYWMIECFFFLLLFLVFSFNFYFLHFVLFSDTSYSMFVKHWIIKAKVCWRW